MVERPEGLKIAACFIAAILIVSLVSRVIRACELRATGITFDETAAGFLRAAVSSGVTNVIANEPNERDEQEYQAKWQEEREVNGSLKTSPRYSSRCRWPTPPSSRPTWRSGARSGLRAGHRRITAVSLQAYFARRG